jgi:hypothetical protein
VVLDYSEGVLNDSGLICTTIWKLIGLFDAAVPPDGLMSAESSAFPET